MAAASRSNGEHPGTIARVREHMTEITNRGSVIERKAAIETLVHEVQLPPRGAVPVFKIPTDATMPSPERMRAHVMKNHRFAQWCGRWS